MIVELAKTADVCLDGALKALAEDDLFGVRELIDAAKAMLDHIVVYPT